MTVINIKAAQNFIIVFITLSIFRARHVIRTARPRGSPTPKVLGPLARANVNTGGEDSTLPRCDGGTKSEVIVLVCRGQVPLLRRSQLIFLAREKKLSCK